MSQWGKYEDEDTFCIYVDAKPDESIPLDNSDQVFCTTFVSTASCIKGAREADLPWLKQYKESESLEESIEIVDKLIQLIVKIQSFLVFTETVLNEEGIL